MNCGKNYPNIDSPLSSCSSPLNLVVNDQYSPAPLCGTPEIDVNAASNFTNTSEHYGSFLDIGYQPEFSYLDPSYNSFLAEDKKPFLLPNQGLLSRSTFLSPIAHSSPLLYSQLEYPSSVYPSPLFDPSLQFTPNAHQAEHCSQVHNAAHPMYATQLQYVNFDPNNPMSGLFGNGTNGGIGSSSSSSPLPDVMYPMHTSSPNFQVASNSAFYSTYPVMVPTCSPNFAKSQMFPKQALMFSPISEHASFQVDNDNTPQVSFASSTAESLMNSGIQAFNSELFEDIENAGIPLPDSQGRTSSKSQHICNFCGKLYSRRYGLKIHLRTHSGLKPLTCKYCDKRFSDPSNLNKHTKLHFANDTSAVRTKVARFSYQNEEDEDKFPHNLINFSNAVNSNEFDLSNVIDNSEERELQPLNTQSQVNTDVSSAEHEENSDFSLFYVTDEAVISYNDSSSPTVSAVGVEQPDSTRELDSFVENAASQSEELQAIPLIQEKIETHEDTFVSTPKAEDFVGSAHDLNYQTGCVYGLTNSEGDSWYGHNENGFPAELLVTNYQQQPFSFGTSMYYPELEHTERSELHAVNVKPLVVEQATTLSEIAAAAKEPLKENQYFINQLQIPPEEVNQEGQEEAFHVERTDYSLAAEEDYPNNHTPQFSLMKEEQVASDTEGGHSDLFSDDNQNDY